ncbi:MAG TPA: DUF2891 family protein [Phycisphaerae bacterium]|nr:DUF2891 family protein [Phycisphaerae bacterium]
MRNANTSPGRCPFLVAALTACVCVPLAFAEPPGFLQKPSPNAVRVMCYNVNWDAIFPDDDPKNHQWRSHDRSAEFLRVVRAVQPDVLCIQEIRAGRDPQDVGSILDTALPLGDHRKWQVHQGEDNVIASRYPMAELATDTVPSTNRGHAMALVDLPDAAYPVDLYLINAHFKAAGGERNIQRRQQHADAIVHWIGDVKTIGGRIDVPSGTPVMIMGDLNVYDTDPHHHLTTLLTGDISDETTYGPDIAPDWDGTDLTDALPLHNGVGPERYTWRNDAGQFKPGPLDRIIYTDSVLSVANAFVLNTAAMSAEDLQAAGLQSSDVLLDPSSGNYDHLPLVVDFVVPTTPAGDKPAREIGLDASAVERFAKLALDCLHREYPNKIAHVLNSDGDVRPPRELTPVFCGCYDWHSAVHGHWLLVRLCRTHPDAPFVGPARQALAAGFTAEKVAAEVTYLQAQGRNTFERPYGLAWFLQLSAELHEWDDPQAGQWSSTLEPLEKLAADRLREWLPKLSHPIRTGEHSQTAFALGLVLDWARSRGDAQTEQLVVNRARVYYLNDRGASLSFEPDGQAFLSPILAEADLMRRILPPAEYAAWLGAFLPELRLDGSADWLQPAVVTDRTDGKLVHLDGLNLSRAWMLEGMAAGLPPDDPRRAGLLAATRLHRNAGLQAVTEEHYESGHWLGSFAVYLVTQRGLHDPGSTHASPPG